MSGDGGPIAAQRDPEFMSQTEQIERAGDRAVSVETRVPHGELLRQWQEERHEWHRSGIVEIVSEFAEWLLPIPMVLHCPACGTRHIDQATDDWPNPPHRSHLCGNKACGCIWRPADVPTVGVERVATASVCDNWPPKPVPPATDHARTSPGPVNCLLRLRMQHPGERQPDKCERCGSRGREGCIFFELDGTAKQPESPCSDHA